jgi:hypothetical protein
MLKFQEYYTIDEALKIVKKNWKSDFDGYKVEYNDVQQHELISRIQSRTDLTLNDIKKKLDKAIQYIIKKNEKGFFKTKVSVAIEFKESEFKALFLVNPENNYIRLNTILSKDMSTKNTIRWDMNESEELIEFSI